MRRRCHFALDSPGIGRARHNRHRRPNPEGILRRDKLIEEYREIIDLCLQGEGDAALPPVLARARRRHAPHDRRARTRWRARPSADRPCAPARTLDAQPPPRARRPGRRARAASVLTD